MLYSKHVKHIPARRPINEYFRDDFSFQLMFDKLFPPQMISNTHGLDIYWEVQLIHPNYVDQELEGPVKAFRYEDFLSA